MPGSRKDPPIKVAIVGGGCAGLAAAWELAKQPGYEIHVYEKSWRLGGKGASVRDKDGRILEHGLHVWMGFYENAFGMMRECYTEVERRGWGPDEAAPFKLPHGRLNDAFFPEPLIGVARRARGEWTAWTGLFPPAPGLPGEPLDAASNPFTLASYVTRCLTLLRTLILSVTASPAPDPPGAPRPDQRSGVDEAQDLDFEVDGTTSLRLLIERAAALLRGSALTSAAVLLQAVTMIEVWIQERERGSPQLANSALQLLEAMAAQTRKLLRDVVAVDEDIRSKTDIIDLVITILVGLFRDRVPFSEAGLDSINQWDYRQWLLHHGATHSAVESPFVQGVYDLVFAYADGDKANPQLAAGVAIRGALRMFFTYRGAMFWRMRTGMGDAVFAPLYAVLRAQGRDAGGPPDASTVQFHFGHALTGVDTTEIDGGRFVTGLRFQVHPAADGIEAAAGGALDDRGCWPAADPFAGQAPKPRTLRLDKDFDRVILAPGVADLTGAFGGTPLPEHWAEMVQHVRTVATQSAQVWLDRDVERLGWGRGSGLFTAFDPPFDTWADMTHTLPAERRWRGKRHKLDRALSVAYFCGPLPDTLIQAFQDNPQGLRDEVDENLTELLRNGMRPFWREAYNEGGSPLRAELARYVTANVEGSDRYTLSLPDSLRYRISPLDRSFGNMTVAGDWTASGLDSGCVESAVMSGRLAAFAVSGSPDPRSIIGYDHP